MSHIEEKDVLNDTSFVKPKINKVKRFTTTSEYTS